MLSYGATLSPFRHVKPHSYLPWKTRQQTFPNLAEAIMVAPSSKIRQRIGVISRSWLRSSQAKRRAERATQRLLVCSIIWDLGFSSRPQRRESINWPKKKISEESCRRSGSPRKNIHSWRDARDA